MQLMAERGLEHGVTEGFGWIRGEIAPMDAPGLRLPQMGWNELTLTQPEHPLVRGLDPHRTVISHIPTPCMARKVIPCWPPRTMVAQFPPLSAGAMRRAHSSMWKKVRLSA